MVLLFVIRPANTAITNSALVDGEVSKTDTWHYFEHLENLTPRRNA